MRRRLQGDKILAKAAPLQTLCDHTRRGHIKPKTPIGLHGLHFTRSKEYALL